MLAWNAAVFTHTPGHGHGRPLLVIRARSGRRPRRPSAGLRDFWRHLLTHSQVSIDDDVLLDAASELALDQADPLAALGEALLELAIATTESEILDSIAATFGSQRARCRTEQATVIRARPFDDKVKGRQIVTPDLIIDDEHAVADAGHASAALTAWIAAEQREYYRIHLPGSMRP